MAVTRRNKIAVIDTLPNEFRRFTDRDIRWLWHYLTKGPRPILKLHNDNSIQYQTEVEKIRAISRLLRNNDQLINRLINYHSEYVLDSRYLTWIDKSDVRLLLWLHLELNDIQASDLRLKIKKTSECSTEMLYEDIIFSIDTWRIFSVDKIEMLNKMKTDLTQEKTSYPMMKWLDEKNYKQLQWAWEYLVSHQENARIQNPYAQSDYFPAIAVSLDVFAGSYLAKEKFINQMKKAWSQKKYRESVDSKRPVSLSLSKKTRAQLEWLTKTDGIKPAELVSILIEKNYNLRKNK